MLVVEDDPNIVDLIRSNLAVRGFDTLVRGRRRALRLLETEQPDIVLLDLMLPEADGFELCRQIRERSSVAVIVVSARGGERDKVTALNMGADDYMTKPFGGRGADGPDHRDAAADTARQGRPSRAVGDHAGEVVIDLVGQQVTLAGCRVHLTPTEFALLRELAPTAASCSAMRTCCGACGAGDTRPRPSTCGSTSGGCGPSWRPTTAPLIVTAPGRL